MGGGDNEGILDLFCMKLNEVLRVKKLYAREVKEYWNIDIVLGHAKKVRNIAREGKKKKKKEKTFVRKHIEKDHCFGKFASATID